MGAVWAVLATTGLRLAAHFAAFRNFRIGRERVRNLVVVGSEAESARVMGLLQQAGVPKNFIGTVNPTPDPSPEGRGAAALRAPLRRDTPLPSGEGSGVGSLAQLAEIVRIYRADEVIFCSKDVRAQDIMAWMTRLGPAVAYKIVPEESLSVIGSSSKDEPGELYTIAVRYNIAQPGPRRDKRAFDLAVCLALLATLPAWLIFSGKRSLFLKNWLPVLLARKTWVGYAPDAQNAALPAIKPSVFSIVDGFKDLKINENAVARLHFLYAKDWEMGRDWDVIWQSLR
jgi:hypothetical protein